MPPAEKTALPPTLRLISGEAPPVDYDLGGLSLGVKPQAPLRRRPGDHLELFSFDNGAELAPIRSAAKREGLRGETGLALVIERALVVDKTSGGCGLEDLVGDLDRIAVAARPTIELWSAHGSYLRHLLGLTPSRDPKRALESPRVAVPVRLIDRLHAGVPRLGAEPELELKLAVAWEIAALMAGQTMGEWAYRSALAELID